MLYAGQTTPNGEDWDVLQIDYGWCYRVRLESPFGKVWYLDYDRRGQSSNLYVKVENNGAAWVEAQSPVSCP